jgi:DNA polymerase-3 subunit delta
MRRGIERGRPLDALLKEARIWGPRQALAKKALQRLSTAALAEALRRAEAIDRIIKGIGQGSLREEFTRLGLLLCTPRAAA